jgi:hypothetical protein
MILYEVERPVALNDVRAVFHRPHPQKETDKGAVKIRPAFPD